jgi:hypothetical protein
VPTKTQREREAEQRRQKLERIREQVDQGSLVIRKMSDAERERWAHHRADRSDPPPAGAKPARARRRRPPLSAR